MVGPRARRAGRKPTRIVWLLIASFALTIASFIASTIVTEHRARGIAAAADSITKFALPSISCISTARTELRQLELTLSRLASDAATPAATQASTRAVEDARNELAKHWGVCLNIPRYEGERAVQQKVDAATKKMNASIDTVVQDMRRGERSAGQDELTSNTLPAIEQVDGFMVEEVNLNARESTRLGQEISDLRLHTRSLGAVLMILSAVLAALAATLMVRVLHRFTLLMEARVTEMEHFAGRVAHDIRSPLAALGLAVEITKRDPARAVETGVLDRASRTLQRVSQLVDGLLVFARSGAPPPETAQADVHDVLADVVEALRPSAEENAIELTIEAATTAPVACTPGVLVSMVSNLVGNAIKYMGSSPVRRVHVHAREAGDSVRIEVRDTGPGIPAPQSERLFDPYTRGAASSVPGIGLGLATVRRLAEAHGGRVGFFPNDGGGSVFWFELPRAALTRRRRAAHAGATLLSRVGLRPSARGSQ